jgi:hypothetical protein
VASYAQLEASLRAKNMILSRRNNITNTDILFLYKMLKFLYYNISCETRTQLALRSKVGVKTPKLLDRMIAARCVGIKVIKMGGRKKTKTEKYFITEKGRVVFEELDHILGVLNAPIAGAADDEGDGLFMINNKLLL